MSSGRELSGNGDRDGLFEDGWGISDQFFGGGGLSERIRQKSPPFLERRPGMSQNRLKDNGGVCPD